MALVRGKSKMADIKKLLGKGKEYTIMGETFILKPLNVEHIDLIFDMQNEAKKAQSMKKLMLLYMAQCYPEATEEERAEALTFNVLNELMEAVMDVNGLSDISDDNKKGLPSE